MEAARSSEMLVSYRTFTWRQGAEDFNLRCRENLKISHNLFIYINEICILYRIPISVRLSVSNYVDMTIM
jgi:hypothetical protein